MAYEVRFWERDGKGEAMLKATRIKRIAEAPVIAETRPISCVRVTLDRSDNQSPWSKDLWVKPGYISPL